MNQGTTTQAIAVLTAEQLEELVRRAVAVALAAQRDDAAPALLDRQGLARTLGVSVSMIARLREQGLPCLMLGDSPRFEADRCIEWLRTHRGAPTEPEA